MAILVVGLLVLSSASTVESYNNFGTTTYYFMHQLLYGCLIGLVAMAIISKIDYHYWQKFIIPAIITSIILLILVKVPHIGFSAKGASRWIHLGPIFFQPAEIAKLAVILFTAGWLSKTGRHSSFKLGLLPALAVIGVIGLMTLWQPDLGSMLSIVLTAAIMLFVGGVSIKQLGTVAGASALALLIIIKIEPYRAQRLTTFLNRTTDPLGIAYHINQAILAIGSGGWWGYGYGLSRQKHNYLPEAIGDSVFAIMAEELGLIRVLAIITLFLGFSLRGIKIATEAPDRFGKILGFGIMAGIIVNAIINIGAIMGLLPLTGIPLPFFSYGSSSMIITLASLGIVLNISRYKS